MESLYDSWFTDLNLLSLKLAKPELGVICFSNKVVFLKITDVDSFGSCPGKLDQILSNNAFSQGM
jgi:hypothetical protein